MATTTPAPPPLRDVRLYGHLGATFGRLHQLAVSTAAEAVQALCVVLPGFDRAFLGPDGAGRYHVYVGRGTARNPITLERAADPVGRAEPICIVPLIGGAKSGFATALLGAALLFAAPYLAGAVGTSFGIGAAGLAYAGSVMVGRALVIGGVIQLLSPQRKGGAAPAAENKPSYAFDGPSTPPPRACQCRWPTAGCLPGAPPFPQACPPATRRTRPHRRPRRHRRRACLLNSRWTRARRAADARGSAHGCAPD
jgi:predicted phage tail protein